VATADAAPGSLAGCSPETEVGEKGGVREARAWVGHETIEVCEGTGGKRFLDPHLIYAIEAVLHALDGMILPVLDVLGLEHLQKRRIGKG
jgi:hypothetical protein